MREKVAEVVYAPISKIILYRIMCGENTKVEMGDIMYQNVTIGKKMTDDIDEELDKLNIKDSDIFNWLLDFYNFFLQCIYIWLLKIFFVNFKF